MASLFGSACADGTLMGIEALSGLLGALGLEGFADEAMLERLVAVEQSCALFGAGALASLSEQVGVPARTEPSASASR